MKPRLLGYSSRIVFLKRIECRCIVQLEFTQFDPPAPKTPHRIKHGVNRMTPLIVEISPFETFQMRGRSLVGRQYRGPITYIDVVYTPLRYA